MAERDEIFRYKRRSRSATRIPNMSGPDPKATLDRFLRADPKIREQA